jgi:hypothetical protein
MQVIQICSVAVGPYGVLLSEEPSPSAVIDGLDDMIRRMQQILGGWAQPDSWALVENSYLQLVEMLEHGVRSWCEDDDGAQCGDHRRRVEVFCDCVLRRHAGPAVVLR